MVMSSSDVLSGCIVLYGVVLRSERALARCIGWAGVVTSRGLGMVLLEWCLFSYL